MIEAAKRALREHGKAVGIALATVGGAAVASAQSSGGGSSFDVSTLYAGAAAAFTAAATVAGGFLAVKYGAKLVKKAWAWLT
jgi:hypothetical protein